MNQANFVFRDFEPKKFSYSGNQYWVNPSLSHELAGDIDNAIQQFIGLKTSADLASILEVPVGQLLHILYAQNNQYTSFEVKKKSGKSRLIESPRNSIRILQNKVRPLIEAHYRVKKPVHGFVGGGKGIVSNAEQHKKKNYLLNIDLQDFFHSVNFGRVQGIFRNTPFNMGKSAATVLAQLCTYNQRLPQGASTSPVLSNLAAASLDKKLVKIAKRHHLTYTRYADDITFSSNKPFSTMLVDREILEDGTYKYRAGKLIDQAVEDSGFKINHSKTRVQHKSQRQEVTGLVVNDGVNVNRKFIRKTRAMINEWRKDILAAEIRFIKERYHADEAEIDVSKLDGSILKRAVYGHLSFIRMVKGEEHSPYLTLCKQVLELDGNPPDFVKKLKGIFNMYDVFICHASEDKEAVATPLYESLTKLGINTFIDSEAIKWGDSLVSKINTALKKSKYVVAVISEESINKSWPMKEINAVLSLEIGEENTKLLPLMVGDGDALLKQLPLLGDKLFESFNNNAEEIARKLAERLQKS
ncbi:TIR domain-containing protein [Pseudoalteromonas sp. S4498]|uniref:TIR domain-containing anti-phage reverse transcriptase n=1 Tax=Pseudoalteromonas galatheae TaxID=579562 RepID=UPI001109745D|nr:TIR domain-containing anti-phage reverse transcriptase [Pseudoalteromonas galatheae]NKC19162.1 TIR domain-containing protein [Pseudoalteromonas galatheae]